MPYNILVVDDSYSMRKVIRKSIAMSQIGEINFFEAANGQEALKVLRDEWVDLVFTDINMPVMDGFELVNQLKADENIQHTPIIVVTSDTNAENADEVKTHDIRYIIYKPFRPEVVRELLLNLLGLEENTDGDDTDFEGLDF